MVNDNLGECDRMGASEEEIRSLEEEVFKALDHQKRCETLIRRREPRALGT